jgi:hypothetical protein
MIEPFDQVAICKQVEAQHGNQIRLNRCVHEYNSWTRFVLDRTVQYSVSLNTEH